MRPYRKIAKLAMLLALLVVAQRHANSHSEIVEFLSRVVGARAFLLSVFTIGQLLHGDDEILSIV